MIRQLNKNIKDLIELVKTRGNNEIYFFMNFRKITKSNDWLYIYVKDYFDHYYPQYSIRIIHNLDNNHDGDIIVFIDDCIYSGMQMAENVSNIKNPKKLKNLIIFILCPYISTIGFDLIKQYFEYTDDLENNFLIFNKYSIDLPNIQDYLNGEEIDIINEYIDYDINNSYLIYFDHKLADQLSTITSIYSGYLLNEKNADIFNNLDLFSNKINLKKADFIPVINNCEKTRNLRLDATSCPHIPYSNKFKDYMKEYKKYKKYSHHSYENNKKIINKDKNNKSI